MSNNTPGPREQALRAQREDLTIPDFLDRTKGKTKEQIRAETTKARKRHERHPATFGKQVAPEKKANLTERDKAVIAELKKLGAQAGTLGASPFHMKKTGAALKGEMEKNVTKKAKAKTTKAKAIKTKAAKPDGQSKKEIVLGLLKSGATMDELTKATGWTSHSVHGLIGSLRAKEKMTISAQKKNDVNVYRIS
jgi:hypothetical protein